MFILRFPRGPLLGGVAGLISTRLPTLPVASRDGETRNMTHNRIACKRAECPRWVPLLAGPAVLSDNWLTLLDKPAVAHYAARS
ncbi:MAG: hypothetical protein K8R46_09475, partial [Pirellulales bacterium]|nr:hypothetical protein [Pirellulales bacterium]